MANVIIIHGSNGNPEENWFPWLKLELEKRGFNVYVPQFPIGEEQTLENWKKTFLEYKQYINPATILVGHSLGCPFILSLLEDLNREFIGVFLVAGFYEKLGNDFDEVIKSFVDKEFDFEKIRKRAEKFYVYASDNDPYVPLQLTENLAKQLDDDVILVPGAGHFNSESDFKEFEDLLIDILSLEQ